MRRPQEIPVMVVAPEPAPEAAPEEAEEPEQGREDEESDEEADRLRLEKKYAREVAKLIERQVAPNEEAKRRRGKKNGLGSPEEKPEVIVETLIRAMASGRVDVGRFLDPRFAVFDLEDLPGAADTPQGHTKHRCGDAKKVVQGFLRAMARAEKEFPEVDNLITCTNEFALRSDPSFHDAADDASDGKIPRLKHVTCEQVTRATEWSHLYRIEWLPDPQRGWRIGAITLTEIGSYMPREWGEVARELASPRRCLRGP